MVNQIHKVELIVVIHNDDENTGFLGINEYMGVEYIKSYLEREGISVNIHIVQNKDIGTVQQIFTDSPQLVGLCMYSDNVQQVIATARQIRSYFPESWITVGGPQVNRFEERILHDHPYFDIVFSYEAEESYLDFIRRVNSGRDIYGCLGITYRDSNKNIIQNPYRPLIQDLDSLPPPSRCIHERYRQQYLYITGSRGCLGGCSFCGETSTKKDIGKPYIRQRSPMSVVNEIQELSDKYKINAFRFTDATFEDPNNADGIQRAEAIYHEIIRRNLSVSLHLFTRAEIVNVLPASYYLKAKQAGVECFYIGIESGNSEDIQIYHKRTTVEKNRLAIQKIRNAGIYAGIGFINFNPYSTFDSIKQNIDFLYENGYGHVFYLAQTRLELLPQSYLIKKMHHDRLIDRDFNYQSHFYDYQFQNQRIGRLYHVFKMAYTVPPIYYMDTLSNMNRVWAGKHLTREALKKIEKHFTRLDELRREYEERNYNFAVKALDMCANDAPQKEIEVLIAKANLNAVYQPFMDIYNLLNIKITKARILNA